MTNVLFLFLDGIGLGGDDPEINPFVQARLPNLNKLIGDQPLTLSAVPYHGEIASLIALDATLGMTGAPQSASGQAVLLTGRNVPKEIGGHYGPKPNPQIAEILNGNNLFMEVIAQGGKTGLLNAYPPGYFQGIHSGKRLYSAIPMALKAAGLSLKTAGFPPAPLYSLQQAGVLLAELSRRYDLAWFDFWPSDYAGHRRVMEQAIELLESFDQVFGALINAWNLESDLIMLTSDHGNLEDLSKRSHTLNPVPCILVGPDEMRIHLNDELSNLTDVAPAIRRILDLPEPPDLS
jgi:bisphosphoglycerate-independent phosphoglycerate mutase (AlkP superfamily)